VAQRAGYSPLLLGQNADVTDGVKAAREDTARLQQQLAAKQKRQQQLTTSIQQKQAAVQKALVDLDAVKAQVKGDLVQLVAEAELAQEAAAVAAAKTAAERQAAELRRQREQQRQQQNAGGAAGGNTGNAGGKTGGNPGGVKVPPANIPDFPAPSPGAATAVAAAKSQLGVPYKFAAATPGVAFDCSGLTMWAWGRAGVGMAHFARSQYEAFPHVPLDSLQPGDLVFFYQDVHHVGIYIGGGLMIDAPHSGATVRVTTMYTRNLIGAARPG
jgi:peptidoglycan DL-endopeptidase CwlO